MDQVLARKRPPTDESARLVKEPQYCFAPGGTEIPDDAQQFLAAWMNHLIRLAEQEPQE